MDKQNITLGAYSGNLVPILVSVVISTDTNLGVKIDKPPTNAGGKSGSLYPSSDSLGSSLPDELSDNYCKTFNNMYKINNKYNMHRLYQHLIPTIPDTLQCEYIDKYWTSFWTPIRSM